MWSRMSAGQSGDQTGKTPPVIGKQGARGLLEIGEVAGHHGHEVIGRIARGAQPVAIAADAAGLVDQFAQRNRRAAGLGVEPFPVPRQQRHLARDHAEFWPAAAARLVRNLGFRCRLGGRRPAAARESPSSLPRRSRSRDRPLPSLKIRIGSISAATACLTASATSARGPVARRRWPSKAVKVWFIGSIPGYLTQTNNTRV